jgi:galactonate dehydratase
MDGEEGIRVRITALETFLVPPRWLFLRIDTDAGVSGWGEPVVEGRAATVDTAVHELAEILIGTDPLRIEDHWQVLSKGGFYRGGPILSSAVAGVDQALWDIAGKVRGAPVHELLGGPVRDRARVYTWVGGDEPAAIRESVAAQVEAGLSAVKMNACGRLGPIATSAEIEDVVARVQSAREVLGTHRDVAVDFHGRVSPADAHRLLPLLAQFRPLFVEEPLLPEHGHLLGQLAHTDVPVAAGERLYSRWDFLPLFGNGLDVAQPDLSHAGGISEVRRIAALAEVHGVTLAPHCPLGPIALAASLQIAFATPNFLIQEHSRGIHYHHADDPLDYLVDPSVLAVVDGHIARPPGAGLGIEVDEQAVRAAADSGHCWRSPVWRHADGSFAEW